MRFVPLLLLALPFVELWLMIKVGSSIGALATIALLIIAGIAGSFILRWQGLYTLMKVQERLQRGDVPADAVFDGMLLALAGVCLFIPGFITDALAALLLVPPLRHLIARTLLAPYFRQATVMRTDSDIIEGEWRREDDPRLR